MDNKDGLDDKIERYLNQEMKPEEQQQFQKAISTDQDLREEIHFQREMKEFLQDSPENALRRNLQKLNAEAGSGSNSKRYWYLLLLLPLLGVLWWFNSPTDKAPEVREIIEVEAPIPPPVTAPEAPKSAEPPSAPNPPPTPPQNKSTKELPQDPVPSPPTETAQPIAANFESNPALEFLINNNVRSNGIKIDLIATQSDVSIENNSELVDLQFSSRLSGSDAIANTSFKLHLFNNDPQRFEDFEALQSFDLLPQKEEGSNNYLLSLDKEVQLSPGLYYQVLEDFDTESILWVGKFVVRE